jgi:hypothetical protein
MDAISRLRPAVRRRMDRVKRRSLDTGAHLMAGLSLAAVVFGGLAARWPDRVPLSGLALVVLVGGSVLSRTNLLVVAAVVAVTVVTAVVMSGDRTSGVGAGAVITATGVVVLLTGRIRQRLGLRGTTGESMLIDLRDRLRAQGRFPELPEGWQAEAILRSAGGQTFGGDFLVANLSDDGRGLQVVLVDVSGKGLHAGTRALLLSGAFGGLLTAMSYRDFLPAANDYLVRQEWPEGFATAVHLTLEFDTGDYVITHAGHPPSAQYSAGSGRWHLREAEGLLLGVTPEAGYVGERGTLAPGDALLLYTDGLIEEPGRDIGAGIDRLLGEAERLIPHGFRQGAARLIDVTDRGETDDRALVLIWRS